MVESDIFFKYEFVMLIFEGDYVFIYMREKRDIIGVYYDVLLNFIKVEGYKVEGFFLIWWIVDFFIFYYEEEWLIEI